MVLGVPILKHFRVSLKKMCPMQKQCCQVKDQDNSLQVKFVYIEAKVRTFSCLAHNFVLHNGISKVFGINDHHDKNISHTINMLIARRSRSQSAHKLRA